MISKINNISFTSNYPSEKSKTDKSEVATAGAVGTAGTITVGNRVRKSFQVLRQETVLAKNAVDKATSLAQTTGSFYSKMKLGMLKKIDLVKNMKFFKPIAKIMGMKVVKGSASVLSAISAVGIATTSLVNTYKTGGKLIDKCTKD